MPGNAEHRLNGLHTGRTPATEPLSKHARPLDPDIQPWERQPGESAAAYEAFKAFRDGERRRVRDVTEVYGQAAPRWSAHWSWGYRAYEFDRYLDRLEVEEMARYRRQMNDRHRRLASTSLSKVVTWLTSIDGSKLTATEAVRMLEVASRLERMASGADAPGPLRIPDGPADNSPVPEETLRDMLNLTPEQEAEFARQVHLLTRGE